MAQNRPNHGFVQAVASERRNKMLDWEAEAERSRKALRRAEEARENKWPARMAFLGLGIAIGLALGAGRAHADAPGPGDTFASLVCDPITQKPITLAPQDWAGKPITYANSLPHPERGIVPVGPVPGGNGSTKPKTPEEPPAPVDGPWSWANMMGWMIPLAGLALFRRPIA